MEPRQQERTLVLMFARADLTQKIRALWTGESHRRLARTVAQWNTGDMEFETLANQHKDEVYRQMIRACGNREDAEDVLVEALVKAHRHLGQLRDAGAFRAWLAQIARRVCWQLKQREALQPLLQLSVVEEEGREIPSGERPLEQQIALRQMSLMLHEAVDKLSEEYRSVYVWRDLEDVPAKEVAKRLGMSLAAVKSRLHRARESVRNALDVALMQQPGAKKFVGKRAGVSPRRRGKARNREG